MKFTLEINCDNAAFEALEMETQAVLVDVGRRVYRGEKSGYIYDFNGNKVGSFQFSEDDSD